MIPKKYFHWKKCTISEKYQQHFIKRLVKLSAQLLRKNVRSLRLRKYIILKMLKSFNATWEL